MKKILTITLPLVTMFGCVSQSYIGYCGEKMDTIRQIKSPMEATTTIDDFIKTNKAPPSFIYENNVYYLCHKGKTIKNIKDFIPNKLQYTQIKFDKNRVIVDIKHH